MRRNIKWYVEEHKKMFEWIAKQYDEGRAISLCDLKFEYGNSHDYPMLNAVHNSLGCTFSNDYGLIGEECKDSCLFVWVDLHGNPSGCSGSVTGELGRMRKYHFMQEGGLAKAAALARDIANTPVRESWLKLMEEQEAKNEI